jgi:ADP-ribose pyrophosphatase
MSGRDDAISAPSDETKPGQIRSERIYTGRIINLDRDTVRFPDGSVGELEMVRHPGASAVVPFVSEPAGDDPQILLLRQYRYAAEEFLYEVPAGRLDAGEAPLACANRELREETGCTARNMEFLFTMFTTPGFTDERIHVFMASGLEQGEAARESDEFTLSTALRFIQEGRIKDGKTALAILYAAGFRAGQ